MKTTKHNITNTAEPIKPGYKKTKVGIIPEDWEEMRLEQVSKIIMGVSPNSENYNFEGQGKFLIQGNADIRNRKSAPRQYTSEITKECQVGDILMSVRAPVGEIAKSIHNACIGRGVCAIRNNKKADGEFLFYYLLNTEVLWSRFKQGSTFESVNSTDIRNFTIQIPPLPEQKAIADCLSTWDKGIEKLSALIASKKEQKKGLMQGLFSGKLKVENGELIQAKDGEDFTKEWKEVKLGEVFALKKGKNLSKSVVVDKGKHKCVLYGELYTKYSEVIKKVYSSTNEENSFLSKVNDVLIPSSTTTNGWDLITSSCIQEDNVMLGGDIIVLRPKNNRINSVFFSYLFSNAMHKEVIGYTQGGTIIHLYGSDLVKIKLNLPSIEEQTAIAEILQTADKEIELLEKQLTQLELQKKGLMQVLLTGEKRLV